jgi:ribokinase
MIGVVGSLNLDLVARVPRLPAPGQTVLGSTLERHHGGKGGNQAVAAVRLGAPVRFYGAVGSDAFGAELAAGLRAEGVDTSGLLQVEGTSGVALVSVAHGGENTISVLPGANAQAPLPPASFPPDLRWLLLQLELPLATVEAWAQAACDAGVPVLLNAAPMTALPRSLMAAVDTLLVNEGEFAAVAGSDLAAAAAQGPRRVIVTKGAQGVQAWSEGERFTLPAHDVWAVDATGAGDSFTGALAASLWQGRSFAEALARATFAASLACLRVGARAGMPNTAELEAAMRDWRFDDGPR